MTTDVLLIEDNPGDARLIVEMLKEADGEWVHGGVRRNACRLALRS